MKATKGDHEAADAAADLEAKAEASWWRITRPDRSLAVHFHIIMLS